MLNTQQYNSHDNRFSPWKMLENQTGADPYGPYGQGFSVSFRKDKWSCWGCFSILQKLAGTVNSASTFALQSYVFAFLFFCFLQVCGNMFVESPTSKTGGGMSHRNSDPLLSILHDFFCWDSVRFVLAVVECEKNGNIWNLGPIWFCGSIYIPNSVVYNSWGLINQSDQHALNPNPYYRIHVWYICLHLPSFTLKISQMYVQSIYRYTIYRDPMAKMYGQNMFPSTFFFAFQKAGP